MKKSLVLMVVALFTMCLVSCGGSSPEAKVEAYYDAVMNEQFDEAVDMLHFKKELSEEDKKGFAGLLQAAWAEKKVEDYKITETKIDGDKAVVNVELKLKDKEKVENDKARLIKIDGEWVLDSGK